MDEQDSIDQRIFEQLVAGAAAAGRESVELKMQYSTDGTYERLTHEMKNAESGMPGVPSDELMAATCELWALFRRFGKHWKRAIHTARWEDNGAWKCNASFE